MSEPQTSPVDKDGKPLAGRKFRFEVRSAEEAVALIRERLGEKARVLSVEQIGGKGLARFLSSPRLEVIAMVPEEEPVQATPARPAAPTGTVAPAPDPSLPVTASRPGAVSGAAKKYAETARTVEAKTQEAFEARARKSQIPEPVTYENTLTPSGSQNLQGFLRKANFDDELLTRLEHASPWESLSKQPLSRGLSELYHWLKRDFEKVEARPLAQRTAFIGTPGSGKTTALCKKLTSDVFFQGRPMHVLKLESDLPNSDDALRVFCEILNVPFLRDPTDLPRLPQYEDLYVDTAGISLAARDDWKALADRLDQIYAASRVLVVNANYDRDLIKETLTRGAEIGATHLVFTHLDEMTNVTKLWPYLLHSGLTPLFFSLGQNVTNEYSDNVLQYMANRTFPNILDQEAPVVTEA